MELTSAVIYNGRFVIDKEYDFGKVIAQGVGNFPILERDWEIGSILRSGFGKSFNNSPLYSKVISFEEFLDAVYDQPKYKLLTFANGKLYGKNPVFLKYIEPTYEENYLFHKKDILGIEPKTTTHLARAELHNRYDILKRVRQVNFGPTVFAKLLNVEEEIDFIDFLRISASNKDRSKIERCNYYMQEFDKLEYRL